MRAVLVYIVSKLMKLVRKFVNESGSQEKLEREKPVRKVSEKRGARFPSAWCELIGGRWFECGNCAELLLCLAMILKVEFNCITINFGIAYNFKF